MPSRGSAVRSVARGKVVHHPPADQATRQKTGLDDRLLYLADFLTVAAVAALPVCAPRLPRYWFQTIRPFAIIPTEVWRLPD